MLRAHGRFLDDYRRAPIKIVNHRRAGVIMGEKSSVDIQVGPFQIRREIVA
jgi:hypothetical protein